MSTEFTKEQIETIFKNGAVGIDLGTTYSEVAAIDDTGRIVILNNSGGFNKTPSVVMFNEEGETIVGEEAKQLGQGEASRVLECVKRFMGQKGVEYKIGEKIYTPEGISAIILGKLIKDASERLGRPVKSAVITVPAWFDDDARQATMRAAEAAGLIVLGILSEPTAAAIAYARSGAEVRGKTALVYDLGGGTFDVSVIRVGQHDEIEELARDGDVRLGGKEWDREIVNRAVQAFEDAHGTKPPPDSNAYFTLGVEAEKAKLSLTEVNKARILVQHEGKKMKFEVTRADFDSWTEGHRERTRNMLQKVLRDAKLSPKGIDICLPVGGSTQMPQIRSLLEEIFPGKVDHRVEKDLVVAIGACWYMVSKILPLSAPVSPGDNRTNLDKLSPGDKKAAGAIKTVERSARTYGIEVLDSDDRPKNDHFVKLNQALPVTAKKTYVTQVANQRTAKIKLLKGDDTDVAKCEQVAEQSCDLPDGLPKGSPLDLTFTFTTEGMVTIDLHEPTHGLKSRLEHRGAEISKEEQKAITEALRAVQ